MYVCVVMEVVGGDGGESMRQGVRWAVCDGKDVGQERAREDREDREDREGREDRARTGRTERGQSEGVDV
jgi:hypothetical protein